MGSTWGNKAQTSNERVFDVLFEAAAERDADGVDDEGEQRLRFRLHGTSSSLSLKQPPRKSPTEQTLQTRVSFACRLIHWPALGPHGLEPAPRFFKPSASGGCGHPAGNLAQGFVAFREQDYRVGLVGIGPDQFLKELG